MPGWRQGRGLAEAGVHEDVVEGVDASGHDHIRLARCQLQGGQVDGTQRAAAGGVDDTVGATEVEVFTDPSGNPTVVRAGKGILLPGHIGVGDSLHHVFSDVVGDAGVFQRLAPAGEAESSAKRDDQFEGPGDAEDNTDFLLVVLLFGGITRVTQRLLNGNQAEQLGGVDRFQRVRQDVVFHRVEVDRRKKTTTLGIDVIGRFRVGSKIIIGTPVSFRHFCDCVDSRLYIGPEDTCVIGLRKQTTDPDNRQRACGLIGLISAVVLQLRNSLICSTGRGATRSASFSTPACCFN